jgi:hypothetical protein
VIDFDGIKRDESGVAVDGGRGQARGRQLAAGDIRSVNLRRAALSFLEAVRW